MSADFCIATGFAGATEASFGTGTDFGGALAIGIGVCFLLEEESLLPDEEASFFAGLAGLGATFAAIGLSFDDPLPLLSEEEPPFPFCAGFGAGFPPNSSQKESLEASESESSSLDGDLFSFGDGFGFGGGEGVTDGFGFGDIGR